MGEEPTYPELEGFKKTQEFKKNRTKKLIAAHSESVQWNYHFNFIYNMKYIDFIVCVSRSGKVSLDYWSAMLSRKAAKICRTGLNRIACRQLVY